MTSQPDSYNKTYYHNHRAPGTTNRNQPARCKDCAAPFVAYGPRHLYCRACSEKRNMARKAKWAREHPKKANPASRSARRVRVKENALVRSAAVPSRRGAQPALAWTAEVSVPFSYAASKNHVWSMAGTHVYSRKESVDFRGELALLLRHAIKNRAVPGRLWLDIFVQKPNHRGDAVNVVDLVSDAVKDATGVDDRWYSILRLDWEIRKTTPMLWVRIGQESSEPMRICALCGQALPLASFYKDSAKGPGGTSRECRECLRTTPSVRPVAQCGTEAGYGKHRRLGEPICESCKAARYAADARRRTVKREATRELPAVR